MKRYLKLIPLFAFVLGLSSCLKDDAIIGTTPSNIVEFYTTDPLGSSGSSVYPVYVKSFFSRPGQQFDVTLSYSGTDVAPQDITVEVGVDATALAKFNAAGGTQYSLLPASAYTLPSTSFVIKKGERRVTFTIPVTPAAFDFSLNQALPLAIRSSSFGTVSGNFGTVIYAIGARNKYDGLYTVTGSMVDNASAALSGRYPTDYYLQTQTATGVAMFDFTYSGTFGHQITSGGQPSYYGSYAPVFVFDANNNIISANNYYGQPAANGRGGRLDPTGQNRFISGTPGTVGAVFQVKYIMTQPTGTDRTIYTETWTFKGDRP
jgi:hypothetical protein